MELLASLPDPARQRKMLRAFLKAGGDNGESKAGLQEDIKRGR